MKNKAVKFTILLIILSAAISNAQNTYLQKADFPIEKYMATTFTIGDFGYVFGGQPSQGQILNDLWSYDPLTDVWTQRATLSGQGRRAAMAFVIDTIAYVGGGNTNSGYTSEFESYDAFTNTWTVLDTLPFGIRAFGGAFAINGKGYMGLGYTGAFVWKDFWEYDPVTHSWHAKADCYDKLFYVSCFTLGQTGYVAGGDGSSLTTRIMYSYDPVTDFWTQRASIPNYKSKAASFVIDGYGYLSCGETWTGVLTPTADLYQYDPATDVWITLAPLPASTRIYPYAFSVNGKGYIGGGVQSSPTFQDFWEYTPPLNTGINEIATGRFDVWPNPTSGVFHFTAKQNDYISVISMNGEMQNIRVDKNGIADLSLFTPGRYFIKAGKEISSVIVE